jgi:hypothetical protein
MTAAAPEECPASFLMRKPEYLTTELRTAARCWKIINPYGVIGAAGDGPNPHGLYFSRTTQPYHKKRRSYFG